MPRKTGKNSILQKLAPREDGSPSALELANGSRVGVIGGGPSGSLFSYFLLRLARRLDIELHLDIYEPRDFSCPGPKGCNMCGGIVSESLVQILATEGINLPPTVVRRGIDSYKLHMDVGSVHIKTPLQEKRIAAVHRGPGPRGLKERKWDSFDVFLLDLAREKGANLVQERVEAVAFQDGRPLLNIRSGSSEAYDMLAVATGINSGTFKLFEGLEIGYKPPTTTKTAIREYYLGGEKLKEYLGDSMHVFLLNIPRIEFAAIIPKGDYMTVCMLGEDIDKKLMDTFLADPAVKNCLPPDWDQEDVACQCMPRMNVRGVGRPFADRIVFIGDCGMNRLYKDGIGGSYRTAKAAATTALLHGISTEDFELHFLPTCRSIGSDNRIGDIVFTVVRQIQSRRYARRGILRMARQEQQNLGGHLRLSTVLWDTFTGSAPYREILLRTLHPAYLVRLFANLALSLWPDGGTRG